MTIASIWQTLADRLDRLQEAGESVDFWLRDDDAVEPTTALHRLLDLTDRFSVPVTLAVIPAGTDERLSRCLADRPLVDVAVHGWSHQNHAPLRKNARNWEVTGRARWLRPTCAPVGRVCARFIPPLWCRSSFRHGTGSTRGWCPDCTRSALGHFRFSDRRTGQNPPCYALRGCSS